MEPVNIQQIDREIQEHKEFVLLGSALDRLMKSHDFQKVIVQGYMHDEAIRLVHLLAHPAMQTPERQRSIHSQMEALGHFQQYIDLITRNAEKAAGEIEKAEEVRDELLNEDGDI